MLTTARSTAALRSAFLAAALFAPLVACSGEVEADADAAAPAPRVYARAAVVGASSSAGFGLIAEAGREVVLAEVLRAAAPGTFGEIVDTSSAMFFMGPQKRLDAALAEIAPTAPEVVIGVDVLFWFAYGDRTDDQRLAYLQSGITRLEQFLDATPTLLLVGDFPDVRDASKLMMPDRYEPTDATLALLQAELQAFDARRDDVEIVPLAHFVEAMRASRPVELFDVAHDTSDRARFLQSDDLHPTLEGTCAMALMVLDVLDRRAPLGQDLVTDPAEVARRVRGE